MTSSKVQIAKSYWDSKRGPRLMPSRSDIDPSQLTGILPHMLLMDVARNPLNFRYRLIGTVIDEHSVGRHTGQWISDIPDRAAPSKVWNNFSRVVNTRRPSDVRIPYVGPKKDIFTTEQVVLPLSDNDRDVTMLFVVIDYLKK